MGGDQHFQIWVGEVGIHSLGFFLSQSQTQQHNNNNNAIWMAKQTERFLAFFAFRVLTRNLKTTIFLHFQKIVFFLAVVLVATRLKAH